MQISREELSRHYAALSDAELRSVDPNDLTEFALKHYQREVGRRDLSEETNAIEDPQKGLALDQIPADWLETAATACSFLVEGPAYVEEAARACTILQEAGIPSQVVTEHNEGVPDCLDVMVPGALNLKAASVLDRDMFNEQLEEQWRTHLDQLSDNELGVLQPDDICAGLLDRATRLKRVYEEAVARRKSADRTSAQTAG
jgi:hypothetical protein